MRAYIIYALLVGYGCCQYVKSSVKGEYGRHEDQEHAGINLLSIFGNRTNTDSQRSYRKQQGLGGVGVCTTEVPTVVLAEDQSHVPTGNGSHSHSRVMKVCCKGYVQNIHNPTICDPVCTNECVNALCTAPETCTCFRDHVRNLAGFCVTTCPISCQNGHCSDEKCICNDGYTLDIDNKYCVPSCKENCGGFGNCTAPNTCSCGTGYQASADGSCKPICDRCINGDCVAPNNCLCQSGYTKNDKGVCAPYCSKGCATYEQCAGPEKCTNSSISSELHGQTPYLMFNQSYPNGYLSYTHPNDFYNHLVNYTYSNYTKPDSSQYNINNTQYAVQQTSNSSFYASSDNQLGNSTTPFQSNQAYYPLYKPNHIYQPTPYSPQQAYYPYVSQNPSALPYKPIQPGQLNYPGQYPYHITGMNTQLSINYNCTNNTHTYNPNQPIYPNPPNYANTLDYMKQRYPYQPYPLQPYYPNQPYPLQPYYPNQPYPYQPNDPYAPYYPKNLYQPYNPNYQPNYPIISSNGITIPYLSLEYKPRSDPSLNVTKTNQQGHQNITNQTNSFPSQNHESSVNGQTTQNFPECSEPCINGICVEGNRCVCHPGYVMDPSTRRCQSQYAGVCPNGICPGPNICICNLSIVNRTRRSILDVLSKKSKPTY